MDVGKYVLSRPLILFKFDNKPPDFNFQLVQGESKKGDFMPRWKSFSNDIIRVDGSQIMIMNGGCGYEIEFELVGWRELIKNKGRVEVRICNDYDSWPCVDMNGEDGVMDMENGRRKFREIIWTGDWHCCR